LFYVFAIVGMCPKGDDPLTPFSDYRAIILHVSQLYSKPSAGAYTFNFFDVSVNIPITLWSDQDCQLILESMPNIDTVRCGVTRNGRFGGYDVLIQFLSFPTTPYENNMLFHEGNPPIAAFSCDTFGVVTSGVATCTIEDVTSNVVPGQLTCY
jgi:hypothetical protein